MENEYISNRIKSIEKQLNLIRYLMMKKNQKDKIIHLEGSLGEISVSEEDIKEAKKALFS